ncbi:MAG: hypothetical protein K0R72_460 [Clostridia bacterium]|jgi:hypothetical protein|nr:hypothetical protein [Clostridia bacterium]
MKKHNIGISLIVLIITIIIIIIIAGAIIIALGDNNVLDSAKKARFMSDYTNVQDGVNLYSLGKYNAQTSEFELPLKGYLTAEDKIYIKDNVKTLKTKIEELSGSIDTTNLAWINSKDIGAKLSKEKSEKGYIIDVANGQIYDYNGDYFEGQMWHTLDGGVVSGGIGEPQIDKELWNGWIKLTLYYPSSSTEKQWRLGTEGELRADPMLMWQNYTGPITIPLDRVKDVWIKYKIDNKEVIIPPVGTLLVDIVPDKTGYTKVPGVKVHINFDETATVKEYRIGESSWITYTGEFNVTENCIIEARAKKTETIYNADGTVLTTRNIAGRDLIYIGNIGIEETQLPAPTITRLAPVGTEKARVQVTYPAEADKKIYKLNYGIEENYTTEINVENYGTYIIAYYYDAAGKRSKASAIRINDTTGGGTPEGPTVYLPQPPHEPGAPPPTNNPGPFGINIPAPTVVVNPTAIAEEVQLSINAPANADKIYIKLGRYADYQLYTAPIYVRENMDIYAYYRTYMGEKSDTGYGRISNIKKNNRPYVRIDADPYPYSWNYGAEEVNVTINYSDATIIEYSEDGIVYKPYIAQFKVTENKTIYARATNTYGVTETSLNITNIGRIKAPDPLGNLSIGINVNPEPTVSTTRYTKANVSIDYDSKATEKYYRIGTFGELKSYTGAFDVTNNCTIYAYAKGTNSQGQTSKKIDNLSSGITEPVIATAPGVGEQSSKVSVTIDYDKYAKIKRYSIDGGILRDYVAPFEVTKNGTIIYAYSENELGQKSETRYIVQNIIPDPPVVVLDKGQYYILKLNYPPASKNREYKWKQNGVWTGYKEAGILLLKPQYKDQLIQNGTLVKIEDENGELVTFTGDYYFIDVPISELFENLFMRWDRESLAAPQIVITPSEPTKQVTANIVYNPNLIKKQYKILNPDGSIKTDWTDYTEAITVDRKNSVIYARGMDDSEIWTSESMKKITNIDETPPVIAITADLSLAQQKVAVKVNVTDDIAVGKVKWAPGTLGESYFATSGTEILNNSIVNITNNGYYTFYAEDQVGNIQVYTLNVTNVDLSAPKIDIQVSPETTVGLNANVTINYGDSVTKQYKIGTNNITWTNYTTTIAISSYTILANNWQNADGTVTIYAKGKDSAGNEVTVQKKVLSLDLDKPKAPVINSNAGYPVLTSYGVKFDAVTSIVYDTRTDIDNYYSIDNGATWKVYTGGFILPSGTIIAKSVKKDTKLEVSASKSITIPADAVASTAYDGNDSTYDFANNKYMLIDSALEGKSLRIKWADWYGGQIMLAFLNESGATISSITPGNDSSADLVYSIPVGTKRIKFYNGSASNGQVFEIQTSSEPKFIAKNGYMLVHSDPTKEIKKPYQMITIDYFVTSVERLYKIGATGQWVNYEDTPIWLNQGETIYAKGTDQYGNQTRIVSSYTANVVDAIGVNAFDGNNTTYVVADGKYMDVDSTLGGRRIRLKWFDGYYGLSTIDFINGSGAVISSINPGNDASVDLLYSVPVGTRRIRLYGNSNGGLYEIQAANEPSFSGVNGYMLLHADTTKAIKKPYQMVTINYFLTSVQRLYRIGTTGDWLNYEDKAIWVNQGDTIYAKGIDIYGNQSRIISSYAPIVADAIAAAAYDGDYNTFVAADDKYMLVDSSMDGKNVRIKWSDWYNGQTMMAFFNGSGALISTITPGNDQSADATYVIPVGARKIRIYNNATNGRLYEIQPK